MPFLSSHQKYGFLGEFMEKVSIVGIDPSLRNTGIALVNYDIENKKYSVTNCRVLSNPQKYTGKNAILNMLVMIRDVATSTEEYEKAKAVVIESPSILFNKSWAGGTISSIAHISGGAAVAFGLEKVFFFRPTEWNKSRKKDVTHNQTILKLGGPEKWKFDSVVKENRLEHVLDAVSICLFFIENMYSE